MSLPVVSPQGGAVVDLSRLRSLSVAATNGLAPSYGIVSLLGGRFGLRLPGKENVINWPHMTLACVVVDVAAPLSRVWYARPYQAGSNNEPDCFSMDGLAPSPNARNKQSVTCASCPHAQWGTARGADGSPRKGQACSQHRRIAVLLAEDLTGRITGGPLLLRIPPASLNRFAQYATRLYPLVLPQVVTNISFVPQTTGELQFTPGPELSDGDLQKVLTWVDRPETKAITTGMLLATSPTPEQPSVQPPAAEPEPAVEAAAEPVETVSPAPGPVTEEATAQALKKALGGGKGGRKAQPSSTLEELELTVPSMSETALSEELAGNLASLLGNR